VSGGEREKGNISKGRNMRKALVFLALFTLSLSLADEGVEPSKQPSTPQTEGVTSFQENSSKQKDLDYRYYGPTFEHISPRLGIYTPPKGGIPVPLLPYGVFSRKDTEVSKLVDHDCLTYDPDFAEQLKKSDPERYYFLPENPRGEKRAQEDDNFCAQSTFYLPMSSLKATQHVAQELRQAWMRLEERTFFNLYVRLNTPWSKLLYCEAPIMNTLSSNLYSAFGFGDGTAPIPPAINHVPEELLPEGLGADLYNKILDFASPYKLDVKDWVKNNLGVDIDNVYPGYGIPENTPNRTAASKGKFRSTYYFPFLPPPWLKQADYCEGIDDWLPIFYIPALKITFNGIEIWKSDGYPDIPLWYDSGEAERRVKQTLEKMYQTYYPEYLAESLSYALPFVSAVQGKSDDQRTQYEKQLEDYKVRARDALNNVSQSASPENLGSVAQTLMDVFEGQGLYFPTPWQLPLLGGGAAVTPVYEYIYPDPIRSSVDLYAIFDAVSILSKSKDFTDLERLALFLYYLKPTLDYLDLPILPWLPNSPKAGVILKPVAEAGFQVARELANAAVQSTLSALDRAAEQAFGKENGLLFSAATRVLLGDILDVFQSTSPKMAVSLALEALRRIDATAEAFGGGRNWWVKDKNMAHVVAPGIFRFEELKRVFPTSNPFLQYAFGYTTLFLVWDEVSGGILPDPFAEWANPMEYTVAALSRLIGFWHLPFIINVSLTPPWVAIFPDIPRYLPIAPYWVPYVVDRIAWGWVNVPEGYPIPYAKGLAGALLPSLPGTDSAAQTASIGVNSASANAPLVLELYKRMLFPEKVLGGGP
jgi:hypothetical protein